MAAQRGIGLILLVVIAGLVIGSLLGELLGSLLPSGRAQDLISRGPMIGLTPTRSFGAVARLLRSNPPP